MENTRITSAWVGHTQWLDGWEALLQRQPIPYPSLWAIDPSMPGIPISNRFNEVLSTAEITKAERFHQANHVLRYKTAHTVLRLLLAQCTSTDPAAIAFSKGYHSKPMLQLPGETDIQFNLSYTENKVLIGINTGHPVGVDIEWIQRPIDVREMLKACFSDNEITFIDLDAEGMLHRFFTLWTRKEAIMKLTGEGIGEHLPYFEVLDGTHWARKDDLGASPPEAVFLQSFSLGDAFIGCYASTVSADQPTFYRL